MAGQGIKPYTTINELYRLLSRVNLAQTTTWHIPPPLEVLCPQRHKHQTQVYTVRTY